METKDKLYYYHNDINGAPLRLTDEAGNIVWNAHYNIFAKIDKLKINEVHNPIRMQGQYEDEETGLYYNRFRYYDPVISAYVSQDPIGLLGGTNLYSYPINSFGWIDPLGLSCKSTEKERTRKQALNKAKQDADIPKSQQPNRQWTVGDDISKKGGGFKNYEYSDNPTHHGRYYEYNTPNGKKVIVDHTNDSSQGLHTHAGIPPKGADVHTYDFKKPGNKYSPLNKETNHHITYAK